MRDIVQLLAAAAVVLGVGWIAYGMAFQGSGAPTLSIDTVRGTVRVEGSEGPETATIGATLEAHARVRTVGEGSQVVLALGERSRITIESRSSVRVLGAVDEGIGLELEDGRVRATVRPGDGAFGLRAGERQVAASDADFAVGLGQDGTTEVQVESGAVSLEGFGDAEVASAGERILASGRKVTLGAIPRSLLLQVDWPEAQRTRAERVTVTGATDPGSRVTVVGAEEPVVVVADGEGRFQVELTLQEGVNDVLVRAVSVLGATTEASWEIVRDRTGPTGAFEVRY